MKQSNNRILIICGLTATGKTALGLKLAKVFDGEIISADSRQVYKEMDIGTGKDLPVNVKCQMSNVKWAERQAHFYLFNKIPIWGLDLVKPDEKFSVARWVRFAKKIIKDIWKRGKLPIVVGGTGFWIKALVEGIDTLGIKPNWKLRKQLSNLAIKQLREKLKKLDPEHLQKMNKSDRNNPRRLIRAIEVALAASRQPPAASSRKKKTGDWRLETGDVLRIGLKAKGYKSLYKRIDERVEKRIKQGAQKEIEKLFKKYSWNDSVLETTIGYKQWRDFFDRKKDLKETIKCWKFAEHAYARRQMTWLRRIKNIRWFNFDKENWQKDVVEKVKKWYSNN